MANNRDQDERQFALDHEHRRYKPAAREIRKRRRRIPLFEIALFAGVAIGCFILFRAAS
jgi:hypothetical protein